MGKTVMTFGLRNPNSFFLVRNIKPKGLFAGLNLSHNDKAMSLSLINLERIEVVNCGNTGQTIESLSMGHPGISLDTEIISEVLNKGNFFTELLQKSVPKDQHPCIILIPGTTVYDEGKECVPAFLYKGEPSVELALYKKQYAPKDVVYKFVYA